VTTPDNISGFKHRQELVLLPPAWYTSKPPPPLPVVMMIGGEFGHPNAWLYAGDAQRTFDEFAVAHGGNAPVIVFPDHSGTFSNDTECVNGPRSNAADHLTKEVVPYMIANFGVSPDPANWGVVGWSSGGTCAVDLTVMHPDLFSTFVDIVGDIGPNAGTKDQSIARLFGGNADAWAQFDPTTVITKHGPYSRVSGWFAISGDAAPPGHNPNTDTSAVGLDGQDAIGTPDNQTRAANSLCALGRANGISCAVVAMPGTHNWQFAARAFASSLPWLAGQIGTPDVAHIPLPGASHP
jgi:S-formylglutathione hydrolase FrmB